MSATTVKNLVNQPYKYGFVTDIEADTIPRGLNEDIIRLISAKKKEPAFMLEFRLKAYQQWLKMTEPTWPHVNYPPIDYKNIIYYSAPKQKKEKLKNLDEVDPALLETFQMLGIPLSQQKRLSNVAVDAIFDSVSVATTYKEKLAEDGV
ncbi:MAG: Fe-S cluster assembly protein SufB, partial [Crocosphaera sp.]